jgi:hypothetical protein
MTEQPQGGEGDERAAGDGFDGNEFEPEVQPPRGDRRRAGVVAVAVVVPLVLIVAAVAVFGGGGRDPRKIPVSAGADQGAGLAEARDATAAPYGGVRYVAAPDLPALDGKAHAYKLTGAVDAARAADVAKAFGVDGDVQEDNGSFLVTDNDRRVYVYAGGGGQFSYEGAVPSAAAGAVCSPVPPDAQAFGGEPPTTIVDPATANTGTGTGFCGPTPTVPPRPADFPTEDQARATALAALGAAGVAVDGARVEAYDDGYQWQVSVIPVIDGLVADGLRASAAVTGAGITYAYGSLGHAERVDEYPLIGTAKAIEHLNDGTAFFGPVYRTLDAKAAESGVATASGGGATGTTVAGCYSTGASCAAGGSEPGCPANADCAVPVCPDCTAPMPEAPPGETTCTTFVDPNGNSGATCSGSSGTGSGVPSGPGYACPAIAAVPPATVPPCPPVPTSDPNAPPTTVPEPTVITLTGAELGLMLAPSGETDSYLLPAYLFSTADGPGPLALAIDASWLEPVAPPPTVSEVPCTTPDATGPCTVGPPETGGSIEPAPPTTCGPPVQSATADAPTAGSPADKVGCPIN